MLPRDIAWEKIFKDYKIKNHDFDKKPFLITSDEIKISCKNFVEGGVTEPRLLCKQDTRESRPQVFKELGLFILPTKNKHYAILRGEGYIDIPDILSVPKVHKSKVTFELETTKIGNSEMQHLDHAYASSVIRTFMQDPSLVLTIRGRKYTPEFSFKVNDYKLTTKSVQTEVDAGYEGKESIILVEAKNSTSSNQIIRQLYYPFRQWSENSNKKVYTLFFEKRGELYYLWQFEFTKPEEYNSIKLLRSDRYYINE